MRAWFAALLSLVSLFGGHCLNRRWDRVVVFAAVAVAGGIGLFFGFSAHVGTVRNPADIEPTFSLYYQFLLTGLGLLLAASAVVSFLDARTGRADPGVVAPLVAGIVLSLVAVQLVVGTAGVALVDRYEPGPGGGSGAASGSAVELRSRHNFSHHLRLGREDHGPDGPSDPPEPVPEGSAELSGRVVYRGEPQAGVRLRLILNSRYETEVLETDAAGRFSVDLPPGEWRINQVWTEGWAGKPDDGRYTVITGHEPAFEVPYERHWVRDREPPSVRVPEDAGPHLTLRIRRAITVEWPETGGDPVEAEVADDVLRWRDPAGADRYLVTVNRIERDGRTTHYRSETVTTTDGRTRLPLAELPSAEAPGEEGLYRVQVDAFDAEGRLVNHTGFAMAEPVFRLTDEKIVDNEEWVGEDGDTPASAESGPEDVDWAARAEARDRLEAARTLIAEELYGAADTLLTRVDPEHAPPGGIAKLRGYLAASRGRCERAREHFTAAREADPDLCITSCLAGNCPGIETAE